MAVVQRPFFRSSRGPSPTDYDSWNLVFESAANRLLVRHLWETSGHSGYDDWEVAEFLVEDGAPQAALFEILFGRAPVSA